MTAARKRKFQVGAIIRAQGVIDVDGLHWWFEVPEGYSPERDGVPPGVELHGPFKTEAEADEDQRITLLGPDCEVSYGGMWDPAWDKLQ